MKMKTVAVAVLCLSLPAIVRAQTLYKTDVQPVADAVIAPSEYAYLVSYSGMRFGAALSADGTTLYCAIDAPTGGWVAVGLGSLRMDGAYLVLASDAAGTVAISEETGRGHSHKASGTRKLIAAAARESGGRTTLEFSVPAAGFIEGPALEAMIAYGRKDAFASMHAAFGAVSIPVDR